MTALLLTVVLLAALVGWLLLRDRRLPDGHVLDQGVYRNGIWVLRIRRQPGGVVHRVLVVREFSQLQRAIHRLGDVMATWGLVLRQSLVKPGIR